MQAQLLVVESDDMLQLALTTTLRRERFEILAANTVAEAHTQLLREHPMVVLLDLGLADNSGFAVLEDLRNAPDNPLAIVVIVSDALALALEALHRGAFDYLTRPINHDLLRMAVDRAVEHYQLRQTAREFERLRALEETLRTTTRTAAHHISQHLTVIMGETQLLQEELISVEVRGGLDRILHATELAAQTLVELRAARHFTVKATPEA